MLWNKSLARFCSLLGKNSTSSGILPNKPIRAAAVATSDSGGAAAAAAAAAVAAVAGATSVSFED